MTLLLFGLILLAGSINAQTPVSRNVGESFAFTIVAFPAEVVACRLRTPHDGILEFVPEETSSHGRYELLPSGIFTACSINVADLTTRDAGEWEVYYVTTSGDTKSEVFDLTVVGEDLFTVGATTEVTRNAGEPYAFTVVAFPAKVFACRLRTPHDGVLEFVPEEPSPHGRYELLPFGPITACSINVTDLTTEDEGEWEVFYVEENGGGKSEVFKLTVVEQEEEDVSEESSEEDDIEWLNKIEYPTREGQYIDISLSKIDQTEECDVMKGNDVIDSTAEGVVIRDSSDYVSCRLTIGPMSESLIGEWSLCGTHYSRKKNKEKNKDRSKNKKKGTKVERCQLVSVTWYNPQKPDSVWTTTVEPKFDHVVNEGESITPAVAGNGEIVTCHVVTPQGEDLVLDHDSEYPHLELGPTNAKDSPVCSVTIAPIEAKMSGDWVIYGKFINPVLGLNEVRLPINVFVDKEDESSEEDDIEWLNKIEYPTSVGQYIDISLSKIDQTEECDLKKGNDVIDSTTEGVGIRESSDFVSCRITIGPMTESLIGEWSLCGTHYSRKKNKGKSNNKKKGTKVERCQLVSVTWYNQEKPNSIWSTTVEPKFDHVVNVGGSITPAVVGTGEIVTCHVVTPQGEDIVLDHDSEYPHLELVPTNAKESPVCSVTIAPIEAKMLGDWVIYGKFRSPVIGLNEVRLPISMFLYDEENPHNQAYNVTVLNPVVRPMSIGSSLNIEVSSSGYVDHCEFTTPSGEKYDSNTQVDFKGASFVDTNGVVACRVYVGPLVDDLFGNWTLIGKFRNNGQFTELRSTVAIVHEDPENPIEDDRKVEELEEQRIVTKVGASHRVVIDSDIFIHGESCHIRTPTGLQYIVREGFNIPEVTAVQQPGVECGVIIDVQSTDAIGDWTLIARATRHSEKIERRLPVTIYVEEFVEASPKEVEVIEGDNLSVRLSEPTILYDTCKLIGPNIDDYTIDQHNFESCGFTVFNVKTNQQGTWEIVYGNTVTFRAPITVKVLVKPITAPDGNSITLEVVQGSLVEQEVGSANAVYCKLVDPHGTTVFDDFGRCQLYIERVNKLDHHGIWNMFVGYPGKIVPDKEDLLVHVMEPEHKAEVTTTVVKTRPDVKISCSLPIGHKVSACKFRNPKGEILLVTGKAEERHDSHGHDVSYETEVDGSSCSLNILNPQISDLGLWRCAVQTEHDVFYGFPSVLCPWVLENPTHHGEVQDKPILRTQHHVSGLTGEPVTMSCAVDAAIKYCYFRSHNGTVFNVQPNMRTSSIEYVGSGYDAGECGIRIRGLQQSDTGSWSCHAKLYGHHAEQRDTINVKVNDLLHVTHYRAVDRHTVVISGTVYNHRPLEYCRFVRIDGLGFTHDNVPPPYTFTGNLMNGHCEIRVSYPGMLDLHPWTVAAKIQNGDEISSMSNTSPLDLLPQKNASRTSNALLILLYVLLGIALVTVIVGVGPKRNRQWVSERATSVRQSFRKKPLPQVESVEPPKYEP